MIVLLPVIDVYGDIVVIWYFIIKDTNIFAIRDRNASKGVNAKQSKKIQLFFAHFGQLLCLQIRFFWQKWCIGF